MIRYRDLHKSAFTAFGGAVALVVSMAISASALEYPAPGQIVADRADDDEAYLTEDQSTGMREYGSPRMFQHSRYASYSDFFTYTFPVNKESSEIWIAFEEEGECLVTVDGRTVLDEGDAGYGVLTARQFRLTDPALWSDGEIAVTFRDAAPEDGGGPSILWIECGPTTRFLERIRNVEWDTSGIVWSLGLWDGTDHEFTGDAADIRIGQITEADTRGEGTLHIHWQQDIDTGKRYFLILGYLRGSGAIDMRDDGVWELESETDGEEALDLDITDQIHPIDNVVAVYAPTGIDYVALVEVTPAATKPESLRVAFGGSDAAENFSRVVQNTWFWVLGMHFDWTGFIDASPINGNWFQQYWPIDQATAFRELLYWGYLKQAQATARLLARVAWRGHDSNRSGGFDNTAGNMIVADMVSLLERTDYDPSLVGVLWPRIREHCSEITQEAEQNRFGLIKGTNWENAGNRDNGPCLALSTNSGALFALLKAAEAADRLGEAELAESWRDRAGQLRRAIIDHLVFNADTPFEEPIVFPAGTWKYGIKDDGEYLRNPLAGWLWGASFGSSLYGLVDPDRQIRSIDSRTLDFAAELRWTSNIPRVAGYSISLDGEDSMFLAAALSDNTGLMGRLMDEMLKRCDYKWDVGSTVAELSRWALGSPGSTEDTNLVGTGFFLNCARFAAGVDDVLYDGGQLRVIPRLPSDWTECRVNGWPVRYRTQEGGETWTKLNYHFRLGAESAEMLISTGEPVEGVRVRLGPFGQGTAIAGATVDGQSTSIEKEEISERLWVWVSLDTGPETRTVRANVSTGSTN